jgi:hypothetical protein
VTNKYYISGDGHQCRSLAEVQRYEKRENSKFKEESQDQDGKRDGKQDGNDKEGSDNGDEKVAPGQVVLAKWNGEWLKSQVMETKEQDGGLLYIVALHKGRKAER